MGVHPPIHLALSWLVGHKLEARRDRRLVAWAGVVPDLDALSLLGGVAAYSQYHHVLTHGLLAALATAALWTAFARQKWKVLALSLFAFHLHLLCDLVGSGVEGEHWSITYLYPFSRKETLFTWGWDLSSPENAFVWLGAVAATLLIALRLGRTFGERFLTARADGAVVEVLRKLFGRKAAPGPGAS